MEEENKTGCSYKFVSEQDIHRSEYANNSTSGGEIYLSRARQEEIKKLMFAALLDPREKYKHISVDQMTKDWIPKEIVEKEKGVKL